jgi:4-carboxymuconolactone decarboxylase
LIEVFDNFAFDEVISYGNLDTRTRVMMILASTIASQALSEYKVMPGGARNVGVAPVEIKEILYQSAPYVGIAETQELLDFYGEHNIVSEIEIIKMQDINEAYERMLKSDVHYRFVIDMASL